jgi:tRNA-2-methylthio-N6-dimethylallyladenosine synthase
MNEDDSEQVASLLMQMGYLRAERVEEADVVMLVTCSVRAKPEEKAKSVLGRLERLKQERPHMIVGVCGCMAQRQGEMLRKGRPYLDLIVGTAEISRIPDLICQVQNKQGLAVALDMPRKSNDALTLPARTIVREKGLKSFVPVMYGCDNYCAYCVVPYVRGRERSRPPADILDEIRQLVDNGRKEVTLVGQNVNSYGATISGPAVDFADLLAMVNDIPGIQRIRFTTSHPKDLSDKLIAAIRDLEHVCEHIHLPVQSGDDTVLTRMNRRYTVAHIEERIAALRQSIPDIAITTDFLVGFPGETDEQFENTIRLCERVRFDAAFMFAYNPIPGTRAETMTDQLPWPVKRSRLQRLIKLQNEITCEINSSQVGRTYQLLVEGPSPKDEIRLTGLTRQNKTINFPGDKKLVGELVQVRATEAHLYGFVGELVDVLEPAVMGS